MGRIFNLVCWFFVCLFAAHIIWLTSIDAQAYHGSKTNVLLAGYAAFFRFNWIYHYQTLITGVFAIGAALIGANAINRQIRSAERHELERRDARHAAARATLPLALSAISQYAVECSRHLRSLYAACKDGELPADIEIPAFPNPPEEAIIALKEMTELVSPNERSTFARMASKIQVQRARLLGLSYRNPGHIELELNIIDYILDTADVYARAAALFDYARWNSDKIPSIEISAGQQKAALHNMGIFDGLYDNLCETIDRRYGIEVTAVEQPVAIT